jgi:Sec-independent protein translocase protein TatA
MFGISLGELMVIAVIAVILIRPSDVPSVARAAASIYVKIRDFLAIAHEKFVSMVEQGELDFDGKKPRKAPSFSEQIEMQKKAMGIGKKRKLPDLYEEIKDKKTPNLEI